MKTKTRKLSIALLASFATSCLGVEIGPSTGWMSLTVLPIEEHIDQEISFSYRASSARNNETVKIQIWLKNDVFVDEQLVFQDTMKINIGITDISRVFIFDEQLASDGANTLRFAITIGRVVKSLSVDAFRKTKAVIRPHVDGQKIYTSPYNLISMDNGIMSKKRDDYVFSGFESLYEEEFYHHLDLSKLEIISENPFSYSKATLRIKDDYGFYSRLERGLTIGYRELPLKMTLTNNVYRFSYASKLYVDPDTMLMSLSSRDGFVPTNTFFFPKQYYSQQKEIAMSIMITECGINANTIIYDFTHIATLRFVGDCRDSKYCITTRSNTTGDDFEGWKTIEL